MTRRTAFACGDVPTFTPLAGNAEDAATGGVELRIDWRRHDVLRMSDREGRPMWRLGTT